MSKVLITEQYLQDIADAIRSKSGDEDTYTPGEMAGAIMEIETGYPEPTGSVSITENGTYDVKDVASAVVAVPSGGYGIPMSVTANSIYPSSPKQPWQAFGDIPGNFWGSAGRSGNYIQMLFGTPVAVTKIKFSNYYRINTSTYWYSSNVAILASNDNFATYTELYSGTGIAQSETQIEVSLQNTTEYLAYRLVCSDSTAYVGLGRIELIT